MPTVSLTGQDILKINGRQLADFSEGKVAELTFDGDIVKIKTGKNGNSIFAFDNTGKQLKAVLRVLRGSSDDKFLQNIITTMKLNFVGFVLATGQFTKNIGDGQGNITKDTYTCSTGVPMREVGMESDSDGAIEQATAVYTFTFTNAPRTIG